MTAREKKLKANEKKTDLIEEIQESAAVQWLAENIRTVGYGFAALFIVMLFAFKFSMGSTAASEAHYAQAENTFAFLIKSLRGEKSPINTATAIERLEKAADAAPELHEKYDGIIAQLLLIQGDESEAFRNAERMLKRTAANHLPFYTQFTQTTLTIAKKDYKKALEEARQLEKDLLANLTQTDDSFGKTLYVYNTLRVAMLATEAGSQGDEKQAWNDWKNLAQKTEFADAQKAIGNGLEESGFTLAQYIEQREKLVNKKL